MQELFFNITTHASRFVQHGNFFAEAKNCLEVIGKNKTIFTYIENATTQNQFLVKKLSITSYLRTGVIE